MSKRKVEKAMAEFLAWLPNYGWHQRAELIEIVGRLLASVPGGDRFEDLGYEPYGAVAWKELDMITNVLASVDDSMDVEHIAELLFPDEPEEDEDY